MLIAFLTVIISILQLENKIDLYSSLSDMKLSPLILEDSIKNPLKQIPFSREYFFYFNLTSVKIVFELSNN